MNQDIFDSLADLEKRADELVERARRQAREFRAEVERKLKTLADELEHKYGRKRSEIDAEIAVQREKILRQFEDQLRASLVRLDEARREKLAPIVDRVIKAFLEHTNV